MVGCSDQKVEIDFVSHDLQESTPAYAQTIPGAGILIQGRNFQDKPFQIGVLLHELGHQKSISGGHYPSSCRLDNDAYVDEEVSGHWLQLGATNWAASGKLIPRLESVLRQHRPDNWKEAFLCPDAEDLRSISKAIDDPAPSQDDGRILVPTASIFLAFTWVQQNIPKTERQGKYREVYRYLRNFRLMRTE